MNEALLHRWDLGPEEAIGLQRRLAGLVQRQGDVLSPRTIAGADVAYPGSMGKGAAALAVLQYPELNLLELRRHEDAPPMPYIPGLLSFREVPVVLGAWSKLSRRPDLLMVDGQGIAHPRRLGVASHIGLLLDMPAIGCAKSLLCGRHGPVGEKKGSWTELVDRGEVIGAVVRTKEKVKPVYVSVGHKVGLQTAIHWVLACATGHRLPEPLWLADRASKGMPVPAPLEGA